MWWHNWRHLTHLKDEALSPMGYKVEGLPIAAGTKKSRTAAAETIEKLLAHSQTMSSATSTILDWLHHEFGILKPGRILSDPTALEPDAFIAAVRDALPKTRKLTASDIAELKREHTATIKPASKARANVFALELKLSELVNESYGLTPAEVELMWRSAPPRMPFTPAGLAAPETHDDDDEDEE